MSTTQIDQLKQTLQAAKARCDRAIKALAPKHKGGEVEEYISAHEALLSAERALCAAKGEPHAVPIEFPVAWDTGAPLPHLLQNDYLAFLVFFVMEHDPDWDGTCVTIREPASPDAIRLAVVEFKHCLSTRMGSPNEEVFHGHPLHGKGFEGYRPLRVENSAWIRELQTINSVHSLYSPDRWMKLKHYLFGFHDSTFECIAESFVAHEIESTLPEVLSDLCEKLVR